MKSAALYRNSNDYIIHSLSRTKAGFDIATNPFFVIPVDSNFSELFDKITLAIDASQEGVPNPENWKEFEKEFLSKMGLRKHKDLYKESIFCTISKNGSILEFLPTKNQGSVDGFGHLPDLKVIISYPLNSDEFNKAFEKALSLCQ